MVHIARVVPKIQKSYLNYAMACVAKLIQSVFIFNLGMIIINENIVLSS